MNSPSIFDPLRPRDDGRNDTPPATATPLNASSQRAVDHELHTQENLATLRREFVALSTSLQNQTVDDPEVQVNHSRLAVLCERLLPAVHRVDVDDDFQEWIEALEHLPQSHRRGLVLVGGWYSPPDMEPKNLVAPPPELLVVLHQHAVYRVAKKRWALLDGMDRNNPNFPEVHHEFWDWIYQHADHFQAAVVDGEPKFDRIDRVCEPQLRPLLNDVEWHLLQLKCKGLLFHPPTNNPEQGWQDFRRFVDCYRRLPDEFRQRFGPCQVAFQPPSKPAAKPAPPTNPPAPSAK